MKNKKRKVREKKDDRMGECFGCKQRVWRATLSMNGGYCSDDCKTNFLRTESREGNREFFERNRPKSFSQLSLMRDGYIK